MIKKTAFIFVLIIPIFFLSCKEKALYNKKHLNGKWHFENAYRNGVETKTMSTVYFEFSDEVVNSNLFSSESDYPYEFVEPDLFIYGDADMKFKVTQMTENQLIMIGKFDVFNLEIHLTKDENKINQNILSTSKMTIESDSLPN